MHSTIEEAVLHVALRHDLREMVKRLHDFLGESLHLEYAFFVMKQILSRRFLDKYALVVDLAARMGQFSFPSTSHQADLLKIQRSAAFIVLMSDIAGFSTSNALSSKEITLKIKRLLPNSGIYPRLDALAKESRIALMSVMMKQKRIKRLRAEFYSKAERISRQIETRLDRLRTQLLPVPDGLPIDSQRLKAEPAKSLYSEIVRTEGITDRSLLKFFQVISDSPQMSINFFDSGSCEIFSSDR